MTKDNAKLLADYVAGWLYTYNLEREYIVAKQDGQQEKFLTLCCSVRDCSVLLRCLLNVNVNGFPLNIAGFSIDSCNDADDCYITIDGNGNITINDKSSFTGSDHNTTIMFCSEKDSGEIYCQFPDNITYQLTFYKNN